MNRIAAVIGTFVLALALACTQAGCLVVAAAAGAGTTVAYVRGDLESSVNGNPEQVTAASKKAMEEMKFTVISSGASNIDGQVVARTAQDTQVKVVVQAQGDDVSAVKIRVGNFGNQSLSAQILEKIRANVKDMPPTTQESVASMDR